MDQDATWYGGRPRPKQHCVTWNFDSTWHSYGHSGFLFRLVWVAV